jgi:hypothetical protein
MQSRAMFVVFLVAVGILKAAWRDQNNYIGDLEEEIGANDYAIVSAEWTAGTRAFVCKDDAGVAASEARINAIFDQHNIEDVKLAEEVSAELDADPETKAIMESGCVSQSVETFSHLGPGL